MKRKPRRKFTLEFKQEAVRLWHESDRAIREVAKELGVAPGTLSRWAKELGDRPALEVVDVEESPEDELKRLRKRVRELEMEKEILKKATVFFAGENK